MIIEKTKNKILIKNPKDFNVAQTLNCGQIFRYVIEGNTAIVFSKDKKCDIVFNEKEIEISTKDVEYFYNFFDLSMDYGKIKQTLKKDRFLSSAVDYGYGIRIINNDEYEMLVSFIISANNNIKRIKNSIEYLCSNFGENKETYFAFPTLKQLKTATVQDFKSAGLGYRAEQMFETIQTLTEQDIIDLKTMCPEEQLKFLVALKGVGEKVANCIMLFGLGVKNVFPVDTWINKVYNNLVGTVETDRKKITRELTNRYGKLSGFAQQYFFYYYRDNNLK